MPRDNEPRISYQGLKVLKAFLEAHNNNVRSQLAGADIMRAAHISSGTMYPLLMRFEESKILESTWETQRPEDLGRPRRRLYRLTGQGARFARRSLDQVSVCLTLPLPSEA